MSTISSVAPISRLAPVLAQMHGNPVGSTQMRFDRGPYRVGLPGATRLPQRGDVVYVDAQFDHSSCNSFSTRRDCNCCPPR